MLLSYSKSFVSLLLCAALLFGAEAFAKTHPYNAKFETQVRALFYEGNQVSPSKVDAYVSKLQQKRLEIVGLTPDGRVAKNSILIGKFLKDGKASADLVPRLEGHETNKALNYAIAQVRTITPRSSYSDVLAAAYNALDIESSLKIEGEVTILELISNVMKAALGQWRISKTSSASEEASNLFDSRTNAYLSVQDIAALKKSGADLSAYGPAQSTFWQAQSDISKVDMRQASMGANLNLYKGVKIEFPADNTYYLEDVKHSDTKPKVDAYAKSADGSKTKFKLKFAAELNAEPTVSALMMAMGFPTDVTRYTTDIKLIIGKMSVTQFIRDWEVYYRRDSLRNNKLLFEDQVKSTGVTPDGQNFIIFKYGVIEAKPKKLDRLGPWALGDNGNNSLREVRGLNLIQIWVDNTDVTEFVNNRLILKDSAQGLQKFHILSDAGKALGSIFGSMPELYKEKVVVSNTDQALTLSYLNFSNSMKNKITLSDARWATRLMAALTTEQITAAVKLGGWSQCIAEQYIYKISSRRNDLVQNLGLLGERLPNGKVIGLLPINEQARKLGFDGSCDKNQLKAESNYKFDYNFGFLTSPLVEGTRNLILDSARSAIGSLERVTLKSDRFKTELNPIAEIIISPKREIERNMNPTSAEDQYIVKEYLRLGIRTGVAYGAYVDNTSAITFSLVYPVRSLEEARLKKGFVVNALLPRDIMKNDMPASYVLMVEHSFEYGGGVNIDQKVSPLPVSLKAGHGEVTLSRSILDHRNVNNVIFYREGSKFNRTTIESMLGISFLRIPILRSYTDTDGHATGLGFTLTSSEVATRGGELLRAMVNGEFDQFSNLKKNLDIDNRFDSKSKKWNFVFIKSRSEKRLDNITLDHASQLKSYIQYRDYRSRTRGLPGDSETRKVNIEVYTNPLEANKFQINLSVIGFDQVTHDKELDLDYLNFINGLSVDGERVIEFSPKLNYSVNGRWGDIVMNSDSFYYPGAIDRLLAIRPAQFWKALAQSMKVSDSQLGGIKSSYARFVQYKRAAGSGPRKATSADAGILKAAGITQEQAELMSKTNAFLKDLATVSSEQGLDKKVKKLAEVMRQAVFVTSRGFYDPRILGALNRIVGEENFYSANTVSTPKFTEVNMIEEEPLRGRPIGTKQESKQNYLVFAPITPTELYFIFDSWF